MGEEGKSPKTKAPKKKRIFVEQKPIIVGGIVAVVAIAGIVSGVVLFTQEEQRKGGTFIFGFGVGMFCLDNILEYYPGTETHIVLDQIAEGLFDYEITSKETRIIPNLAEDSDWNDDATELTCTLRKNVKFHDGTQFNATVVKWNFERLNGLLNKSYYPYMWYLADGTPILNDTLVIDDYTVKFVLNKPFIPFKALLCTLQSYILSPSSTPKNDFIDLLTGKLIGTGPFIYDSSAFSYDPIYEEYHHVNTTLLPNRHYWGKKPNFDKVVFKVFDNYTKRCEALFSKDIHFTEILLPLKPENFTCISGLKTGTTYTTDIWNIWMDNSEIETAMRKAISYALDYTRLLTIPAGTTIIRCKSPLSKGMLYANWEDFNVPEYDIQTARQALIDANWPGTEGLTANDDISPGNPWETKALSSSPLETYNFTYIIGNERRYAMASLFHENLTQIGINVTLIGVTWANFWDVPNQFLLMGWGPDYNDPANNINPLFSSKADGYSNLFQFNDAQIQEWIEEGLEETDLIAREQLYYDIQERLIEELYPCIWYYTPLAEFAYVSNLRGINYLAIPYKFLLKNAYFA